MINIPKRTDYTLLTYYASMAVSKDTHQLIRKLPAYITADPNEYCHFYIEPNLCHTTPTTNKIKNKLKYGNRAQKMLNSAIKKTTNNVNNDKKRKQHLINHEMIIKMLKTINPNIKIIKEQDLKKIIKPFIDERCDDILAERNNKNSNNEISYFLMDKYGVYKPDKGHHIENVEQWHFGGDYGPNYKGSLFVDPEKYKLRKLRKQNVNNNDNNNNNDNKLIHDQSEKKKEEKVCHGCRHKYFIDEWQTHIASEVHQKYLADPRFIQFTQYVDNLNDILKAEDEEEQKKKNDIEYVDELEGELNVGNEQKKRMENMEVDSNDDVKIKNEDIDDVNKGLKDDDDVIMVKNEDIDDLNEENKEKIDNIYMDKNELSVIMEEDENEELMPLKEINIQKQNVRRKENKRKRNRDELDILIEPQRKKRRMDNNINNNNNNNNKDINKYIIWPKLILIETDFDENGLSLFNTLNDININDIKSNRKRRVRSRRSSLVNLPNINDDKINNKKNEKRESKKYLQRMRSNKKQKKKRKTSLILLNETDIFGKIEKNKYRLDKIKENKMCCNKPLKPLVVKRKPNSGRIFIVNDVYFRCVGRCRNGYNFEII